MRFVPLFILPITALIAVFGATYFIWVANGYNSMSMWFLFFLVIPVVLFGVSNDAVVDILKQEQEMDMGEK